MNRWIPLTPRDREDPENREPAYVLQKIQPGRILPHQSPVGNPQPTDSTRSDTALRSRPSPFLHQRQYPLMAMSCPPSRENRFSPERTVERFILSDIDYAVFHHCGPSIAALHVMSQLCGLDADWINHQISIRPDRRKSKKPIPRYCRVCWMLNRTAYSCVPLGVLVIITFRRRAKPCTACSALLLFHGTLS